MRLPKIGKSRPVSAAEDEAARARGARTLADVEIRNLVEHIGGCHGRRCRGGCIDRTRRRWAAAGWTDEQKADR
ncbi:hypothetical protein [Pseudofrankia sp. BMG5.37]|uniref:hypothetical protein n=1 Tax=Pseudofrankia sp. BMG5.37 TaxID=3050035 RepID=UPI002894045E|nr:hypothetical protein [Pseudofrankia sp. BMG5.37]MDT3438330.1 hypothetical protein [Pseudofrankia sp. BMG5.37]